MHECSLDDKNGEYVTKSNLPAYNMDCLKDWYGKNIAENTDKPASCDALFDSNDRIFLIEFKNGHFETYSKDGVAIKFYESILLLIDESVDWTWWKKDFSFTLNTLREYVDVILVYNPNAVPTEPSKRRILNQMFQRKAKFGLGHFEGLWFHAVYTYTESEFQKCFLSKYERKHVNTKG